MEVSDLGEGWIEATGNRGSVAIRWSKSGINIGSVLMERAGLEPGDWVRVLVNEKKNRVALLSSEDSKSKGNKLSKTGSSGGAIVAATTAARVADVEPPVEVEVVTIEDGAIVIKYD